MQLDSGRLDAPLGAGFYSAGNEKLLNAMELEVICFQANHPASRCAGLQASPTAARPQSGMMAMAVSTRTPALPQQGREQGAPVSQRPGFKS